MPTQKESIVLSQKEAAKLRQEAKDLLNEMFRSSLKIGDKNVSFTSVDRIVDCIVFAAMLEVAAQMGEGIVKRKEEKE